MKKNIIIAIVCIAAAVFVYYGFIKDDFSSESLLGTTPSSSNILGKDIAKALNEIGALSLDTSVFQNPTFKILRNYEQFIPTQEPYRENPFLPVTAPEPESEGVATINAIGSTPSESDEETTESSTGGVEDAGGDTEYEGETQTQTQTTTTTTATTPTTTQPSAQ